MYGLEGRKAIVTGAAHGIGKAIAARLVTEGCDVGIFDVDLAAARKTADAIGAPGRKVAVAAGDVSSKADVEAGIGALMAELGPIDILVNNAGICRIGKMMEMSEADWKATFGINVDGLYHVSRLVVPQMIERGSGSVVNLASWMGKSGVAAYGAYCASKFAVVALTQALAAEIGEHGVRVNAVAPGLIVDTKMRDESELDRVAQGLPTAQDRAKTIPMRRAGLPEDIAKAVVFLASSQADYITGETVNVTGGLWND
ncbi:SDR family NAD(P)-dependent oxidoreductase [Bosea sp. (in: a-proteobacteria)]|jgi:NAD(P)-dependent dehydrogenase (short-subunit alcohol dehydrogenase family)|uniref:SDR family NAD(P)-dependent oxidoreductase n=1 Tax=Bosea sp. (in: a-proteobacteria) TaxID=1871050 RepID=UPI003F707606